LAEHRELRQTLGLASVPDFTTLYRFLQRLDDQTIDKRSARRFAACAESRTTNTVRQGAPAPFSN